MQLPQAVKSHHTAWVSPPTGSSHPVRYAVDGERLVCFGDGFLANVADRARVAVSIHEIAGAGGHLLGPLRGIVAAARPRGGGLNALSELLEHVTLGRTLEEVELNLAKHRVARRVVELVP